MGHFFLLGNHRGKHLDIPGEVVRRQIFGVEGESKLPEETFNSGVITHSSDLEVAWLLCQLRVRVLLWAVKAECRDLSGS